MDGCDTCAAKLTSRYRSLYRQIERLKYEATKSASGSSIFTGVLHADQFNRYCGADCAKVGAANTQHAGRLGCESLNKTRTLHARYVFNKCRAKAV